MQYRGKAINGVVVLDNGETLPEGTAVKDHPVDEPPNDEGLLRPYLLHS